jgi:hypothetical protein
LELVLEIVDLLELIDQFIKSADLEAVKRYSFEDFRMDRLFNFQ